MAVIGQHLEEPAPGRGAAGTGITHAPQPVAQRSQEAQAPLDSREQGAGCGADFGAVPAGEVERVADRIEPEARLAGAPDEVEPREVRRPVAAVAAPAALRSR